MSKRKAFSMCIDDLTEIKGYEGKYYITREGRIWSSVTSKWLKISTGSTGYFHISLKADSSQRKTHSVHRLIAEAYLPPVEGKTHINHIDGNPKNNSLDNLEWCTHKENIQHANRTGLRNINGDRNPRAKLNWLQVREIRKLSKSIQGVELARMFGVKQPTVSHIICGDTWKEESMNDIGYFEEYGFDEYGDNGEPQ